MVCPYQPSTLSTSSCWPIGQKGVDTKNRTTITWETAAGVRFVSYPEDQLQITHKKPPQTIAFTAEAFLEIGRIASEKVQELSCVIRKEGFTVSAKPPSNYICISPKARHALLTFPRISDMSDNTQTPFLTEAITTLIRLLGCETAGIAQSPAIAMLVNNSIYAYLETKNNDHSLEEWADYTDEHYFHPQEKTNSSFDGYTFFSSVAWGNIMRFVLGITPERQHEKSREYSLFWNLFFLQQKPKDIELKDIRNLMLLQTREIIQKREKDKIDSGTIIDFWLEHGTAQCILAELPEHSSQKLSEKAALNGTSEIEEIIADNLILLMIMAQETFGVVIPEFLRCVANGKFSKHQDQTWLADGINAVLTDAAPAAHTRQLRYDTKIVFDKVKYTVPAGTRLYSHPILARLDKDFHENTYSHPFGDGPHTCPAYSFATPWMMAVLTKLINKYKITLKTNPEPTHQMLFTMRNTTPPSFKLRKKPVKKCG